MIHPLVVSFLLIGVCFAGVHHVAMVANLYWYYWWFDIVMHFWGGLLIGLGVHALATFSWLRLRPSWSVMLVTLALITGLWELFESWAGLHEQDFGMFMLDTIQDVVFGFAGGLLAHALLRYSTIKKHG
jgi:predicted dehydrogenase